VANFLDRRDVVLLIDRRDLTSSCAQEPSPSFWSSSFLWEVSSLSGPFHPQLAPSSLSLQVCAGDIASNILGIAILIAIPF